MRATAALYCMVAAAVVAEYRVPALREGPRARQGQDGAGCFDILVRLRPRVLRARGGRAGGESGEDDEDESQSPPARTQRQGNAWAGRGRRERMRDTMREVDTGGLGWVPREDGREELNTQEPGKDSDSESDDDLAQGDDPEGDDFGAGTDQWG